MSDSGRQIGDCRHGTTPEQCPRCLTAANAELVAALRGVMEQINEHAWWADGPRMQAARAALAKHGGAAP